MIGFAPGLADALGDERSLASPERGRIAEDERERDRVARQQVASLGNQIERSYRCPTCHGRRSVPKPRKRDNQGRLEVLNPPDMVCPNCKGEGINTVDELDPLLSAYCAMIDDCRRRWPDDLRYQRPPVIGSILRRLRWTETAIRFNRSWEMTLRAKTEETQGKAFILTVEAMRVCSPASDAYALVQARVLFDRDGKDSDTIYLLFPAGCPNEVARKLGQNRFTRMQVLAFDAGPTSRDAALTEFESGDVADGAGSSSISADDGLVASFRERAGSTDSAHRVLTVANSRVVRPGAMRAVPVPERAVFKAPPIARVPGRRCSGYG